MRAKGRKMLERLDHLCSLCPKRFHIFGPNRLYPLKILRDKICSADSSKQLDGARCRHLIYFEPAFGEPVQSRAFERRVMGLQRNEYRGLCRRNARTVT